MGESASVAQMQNQQNRDQQYAEHGVQNQQLSIDSATYKTDSTGKKSLKLVLKFRNGHKL